MLGQALMAAGRTVDAERQVHSLHAYFLRPGDPKIPIVYDVDRIRDGGELHHPPRRRRSSTVRPSSTWPASFQVDEAGLEH